MVVALDRETLWCCSQWPEDEDDRTQFCCCCCIGGWRAQLAVGVCLRCGCFAGDGRGMVADGGARLVMVPLSLVVCCAASLFSVVVLLAGVDHG